MALSLSQAAAVEIQKLLESPGLQQPVASLMDSSALGASDWHLSVGVYPRSICEEIEEVGGIPFAWGANMAVLSSCTLDFHDGDFVLRRADKVFSSFLAAAENSAT